MKQLLLTAAILLALTAPASAVVDWDEGFEYATNDAMDQVWSSSCPGNGVILFPSTDRFHSGAKSLKEIFRGHQAINGQPATPGYQSCYKDRSLAAPTTGTLYARFWMYMENFTVDDTTTKITLHPAYASDSYSSVWWGMFWGQPQLAGTIQRSDGTSEIYYGSLIPQNQWVCLQTRMTFATPGVSNGVMQAWINGAQVINSSTVRMDPVGLQSVFRAVRLYTQDGTGSIYYDDYAVSRDALPACNPGTPGGGGGPLPDTSPPNPVTNLTVTELWEDLKGLMVTVWGWLAPGSAEAAVPNDRVTVTLSGQQPGHTYDVRWQFFLHPDWLALDPIPATQSTLIVPLSPPVTCPAGADCFVCADARATRVGDGVAGPWLSETPAGKSCNQFAVGPIVLPPPPPVPAPVPPPPATVTMQGDSVTIQCDKSRFTRIKTTGTGTKRVITCLK